MGLENVLMQYKFLLCFLGFALLLVVLVPVGVDYLYYYVRLDYILFASLVLITIAVVFEVKSYLYLSLASTILLEVLGVSIMWIIRIYVTLYTFFFDSYKFYLGGFVSEPRTALIAYITSFIGALLSFLSMVLHRFVGKPMVITRTISLAEFLNIARVCVDKLIEHPIVLGFSIGFIVRFIPEALWGYRLIGYDTVSYAAHLRDFVSKPSFFGSYWWMGGIRNTPPLLNWLLYPFALAVDPVTLFKVYPPIAYGLLSALTALYSVKVLGLSRRIAIVASLIASFSLLSLRMSWDLQKQVLAQILILAAVTLIEIWRENPGGLIKASILLLLASLASEFGAAIAIIVSLYVVLLYVPKLKSLRIIVASVYILTVVASYVLISWYLRVAVTPSPILGYTPPIVGEVFSERPDVYPYIIICLGPLTPLYIVAVERLWRRASLSLALSTTLVLLSLTPLITPWTSLSGAEWDRVLMSASHIVIALAISQLQILKNSIAKAFFILFLVTPGVFVVGPEGVNVLNSTLVSALKRYPRGLAPATPSLEIYDKAMEISAKAVEIGRPIIANPWMERFIHLYIRNPKPEEIVVVPRATPQHVLCTMILRNLSKAFTVTEYEFNSSTVEISKDFCLTEGTLIPVNTTTIRIELNVEILAEEKPFKLIAINIKNIENS